MIKNLIYFILFLCIISCKKNVTVNSYYNQKAPKNDSNLKDSIIIANDISDTTDLKKSDEITNSKILLPNWISQLNSDLKKDLLPNQNSFIDSFEQVNDSLTTIIFIINNDLCSDYYINTYVNRINIDELHIYNGCDFEQSYGEHNWKEYKKASANELKVIDYKSYVNDTILDSKGFIKEKYFYDDIERTTDTLIKKYLISNSGKIIKKNN